MEMIIQNETGNFTLHVRISDSKEYDFLKDVTELARKYDFENDDFEIEDPEKKTDQVPETTISEAAEEYKGFLHIRCEECGETISYNAKEPETQHKCKKCGHVTQLRALKPMYAECKACGSSWKYMTNRNTAELTQECLQCGNLIDMEMNSRRTAYVTKTKRGGRQDLQEIDSPPTNRMQKRPPIPRQALRSRKRQPLHNPLTREPSFPAFQPNTFSYSL